MRKQLIIIVSIMVVSSVGLFLLLSNTLYQRNGFNRIYHTNTIKLLKEFDLESLPIDIKSICSVYNRNGIFFTTTYDPRFYFKFDKDLNLLDTLKVGLDTKLTQNIKTGFDASIIDSTLIIYVKNGGQIIRYNIGSQYYKIINSPSKLITKSLTLDHTQSTLRVFNKDNSQSFININSINGKELLKSQILNSDIKSGFSTDGILLYNLTDSLIFYIQYYTNKFYCLNKHLELLYESHTIDTISHNPITNSKFHTKKSGQFMPEVPLKNINKNATCFDNKLIINSSLIADNEPLNRLQDNYIFDVYNALTGKYISSIVIPKFGTKNLLDFTVSDNKLTLLCNNKLLSIDALIP